MHQKVLVTISTFFFIGIFFLGDFQLCPSVWGLSKAYIETTIHFSEGSGEIREKSISLLKDAVKLLKAIPQMNVSLTGHADAKEVPKKQALKLSIQRAEAIQKYLVQAGIEPSRLWIEAFGSTRPKKPGAKAEDRIHNRRVEIRSFMAPEVLEGLKNVSLEELEKDFRKQPNPKSSQYLYRLGRLHQVAYARQVNNLPAEIWNDQTRYPWMDQDPAQEPLGSTEKNLNAKTRERHRQQAIQYFTEVLKIPREPYIGGQPDYPKLRKLKAYRGLIWLYRQQGQEKKAQMLYSDYLKLAESMKDSRQAQLILAWQLLEPELGPDSPLKPSFDQITKVDAFQFGKEWNQEGATHPLQSEAKADYLFDIYQNQAQEVWLGEWNSKLPFLRVLAFESVQGQPNPGLIQKWEDALDESIVLYENILKNYPNSEGKVFPNNVDATPLRIEIKLAQARAQKGSPEMRKVKYQALLEKAFEVDQKLQPIPYLESGHALEIWREMQPYLDPKTDGPYIASVENRFKTSGLKRYHR